MSFWTKFLTLTRKRKFDADMAEEMRLHLEFQTERNIAAGMSPGEARYVAQRQFGGVEQIKERCRDIRRWVWLEQTFQDVRFAARGLMKNPGFTTVAVLTLAFGIGVNTSMFTALQAVLMRELPYPDSDDIVQVFRTSPQSQRWPHSPANFLDQQAQNTVFKRMAAYVGTSFSLAESGQPAERVGGLRVTADFFPLLGVQPLLGRVFTAEEDRSGGHRVAVIDESFWMRRFASDPNILGRTLRLDGEEVTIVGVMPASFRDQPIFGTSDVWTPLALSDEQRVNRSGNFLKSIARLKAGVTLAQARGAMSALAMEQSREHPDENSGIGLSLVRLAEAMDPRAAKGIWLTMALAGFVLLIACANLANLQFARTTRRTHELAIRGALGASRGRLLRQLLTETLLISMLGGLLGIVLANWGNELLARQINRSGNLTLALNLRVLGFAFAATTIAGFAFGLVPAWLASRTNAYEAMKHGSRGTMGHRTRTRVQHALIIAEVALALVLLAGAGLVVRGLQQFAVQDPGWEIGGLTIGNLSLPESRYGSSEAQRALGELLLEKLSTLSGVTSAAIAWSLPIRQYDTAGNFELRDRPAPARGQEPIRLLTAVAPGYFRTFGIRLLTGRDFTRADRPGGSNVVIVNDTMARTLWPDTSAIGQRVDGEEVVGVVSDVRFATDVGEPMTRFQTYRPFAQAPRNYFALAVRGTINVDTLRHVIGELDADLPLIDAGSARSAVDKVMTNFVWVSWLLSGFGALGLLLASLGIYGVITGFVIQRTNEIGVRIALGAQVGDVLWLVIGRGLRLTMTGVSFGLLGAFGVAQVLASLTPGLGDSDSLTIGAMVMLLVGVAAVACWLPARRASRVDPMVALRAE